MSNDDFAERLNLAINQSGISTKAALATKVGISQQYLQKIIKAKSKTLPPADLAYKLAEALGVDFVWLITGSGSMHKIESVTEDANHTDSYPIHSYNIEVSCGPGTFPPDYEVIDESPIYFKKSWFRKHNVAPEDCRRLRAHGDSMHPIIRDGDYITVNCSDYARSHIQNNKIYAIINDGLLCCKYLIRKLDGTIIIKSENPAYEDERLSPELAEAKLLIVGLVLDRSGDLS